MSHEAYNQIGEQGEAAVAAQLVRAGFHVYAPVFCKPENDMIAEYGGKLIRVQVKTLSGHSSPLRFASFTGSRSNYIGVADWLAFHSLYFGVTAFLKPEEAGRRPTLHYYEPKVRGNSIRFAADYPLERVIKEITS